MTPLPWDLMIYQGDTFTESMRLRDEDPDVVFTLTGLTGKAQIRTSASSSSALAEFTVTNMDQNEVPGGFVLSLTPAQTAALVPGSAVWDIQFSNGDNTQVDTYIAGAVTVVAEVTRA